MRESGALAGPAQRDIHARGHRRSHGLGRAHSCTIRTSSREVSARPHRKLNNSLCVHVYVRRELAAPVLVARALLHGGAYTTRPGSSTMDFYLLR